MKIIKFLGRLIALPINIIVFAIALGLLPVKLLSHWLCGEWGFVKAKWNAFKTFVKKGLNAISRGEKPYTCRVLFYRDDKERIYFFDNKKNYTTINMMNDGKTE